MIYELRTYTLQPGTQPQYIKQSGEVGRKIRGDQYGKFEGGWTTEFGTLNQYVHLWSFADLENGGVTLYGFVRSEAMRRGLRVLASRIEGVERVDDRMEDLPVRMCEVFLGPPGTAEVRDPVPPEDRPRRSTAASP